MPSEAYNGLGMRLTKNDPTGSYAYLTDGLSPASSVLSDNFSTFTPGISEYNSLGSRFYLADASGNSRGLLSGSNVNTDGYNWDAFGTLISRNGSNPTMFAWNEASGYQTDNDDGLTLLGHRYYDKRTGRFLSRDHAKSGGNWYQYAGNNPMNKVDPTGLDAVFSYPEGSSAQGSSGYLGINASAEAQDLLRFQDDVAANDALAADQGQPVDSKHSAWDHYLGRTGTPMSVNVTDLPYPSFDLTGAPSVYNEIMDGSVPPGYTFHIDTNVDLNFYDLLIGRAEGHFIGTLTMDGGYAYHLDGKLFVYPDTYKFNNDPNRGFAANAATNAARNFANLQGGGTDFTINVYGYVPVHQKNGD